MLIKEASKGYEQMLFLESRRVQSLHVHWKTTGANKKVQKEKKHRRLDSRCRHHSTVLLLNLKKVCTSFSCPKPVSLFQFHKLQERSHCCHAHDSYSRDLFHGWTKKDGAGCQVIFRNFQNFFFFVELYFPPKNQNITWSYRIMYVIRDLRKSSGPTPTENTNTIV